MNDKDFKNIENIKKLLKYLDEGKLDIESWSNALNLKKSLDLFIRRA